MTETPFKREIMNLLDIEDHITEMYYNEYLLYNRGYRELLPKSQSSSKETDTHYSTSQ